ncbi:MAG: Flp pilus assembly protein CpaB [Saccharofermentanales bacterium]
MKNRTIIGIIFIILAIAVMVGVNPLVNKLSAQKIDVVQVVRDIPKGTLIGKADVRIIRIGGYNLPAQIIRQQSEAVGKYASTDLKENDFLLPSKLQADFDTPEQILENLNGSRQAISITITSFAGGLSGKLMTGDIVEVLSAAADAELLASVDKYLKFVQVITTTTGSGKDYEGVTVSEEEKQELPTTVTLLVNKQQASVLCQLESKKSIHLMLVYRGEKAMAQQFLKLQEEAFTDE